MKLFELNNVEEIRLKRVKDDIYSLEIDADVHVETAVGGHTAKKCKIKAGRCKLMESIGVNKDMQYNSNGVDAINCYSIPLSIELFNITDDKTVFTLEVED